MDVLSDTQHFIDIIETHQYKDAIVSMFKKGPPQNTGFMWCNPKDTSYWTNDEIKGLAIITELVLSKGYESSGYGCMMRHIQRVL